MTLKWIWTWPWSKEAREAMEMPPFIMSEGISGMFYYHISDGETPQMSLCGKQTMATRIPLRCYGLVTHLGERYCSTCRDMHAVLDVSEDKQ